jgi:hypothetical protein
MRFLLICIVLFIFGSCMKEGPCAGGTYSNKKRIGSLNFEVESENWILPRAIDSIQMKNSKGGAFTFFIKNKVQVDNREYELFLNQDLYNGSCTQMDYVYLTGSGYATNLVSNDLPFKLSISRFKNIDERNMADTVSLNYIKSLSDKILVQIGVDFCEFKLIDTATYWKGDVVLLDSIYTNVYKLSSLLAPLNKIVESYYFRGEKA